MITMEDGTRVRADLQGQIFGRLTVIEYAGRASGGTNAKWHCRCECDNEVVVCGQSLRRGLTTSCGCLQRERASETHQTLIGSHAGAPSHPLYKIWKGMNDRVLNSQASDYSNYGGRGITVCRRWRWDMPGGFQNFIDDIGQVLGPRPAGHTIDRIFNEHGYGPANVRWSSAKEQSRNRRGNVSVWFRGERMVLTDFAERVGVSCHTLFSRIQRHPERLEYNANGDILVNQYLYPLDNVVPFRRAA